MRRATKKTLFICTTALTGLVPVFAYALPQDGVVAAGSANIVTSATAVDITQTSHKAVIDWRGFDIAPNEAARFHQPSVDAVTLNRVNSTSATQIDGMLSANGNIVIVNPNGVVFGQGARVDVGGLTATTSDIDTNAFMNRANPVFDRPGAPDAKIVNAGTITVREAGLVGLVAPQVENSGVIRAHLGKVTLASGDKFTLDLAGDGVTQIAVTGDMQKQVVKNSGTIEANGGTILLTAAAARDTVDSLIENTGVLRATAVGEREGRIIFYAQGSNAVLQNDAAQKGIKQGRSTVINAGLVDVSGKKAGERGGSVQLLADQVAILSGAVIDAVGHAGGGIVEVGGAKLGLGDTPTALVTVMQKESRIDVSSLMSGDAGSVILWADQRTEFGGTIRADAQGTAGNGGFVETSGKAMLQAYGTVSATSRRGKKGQWFLDPANISIGNANVDVTAGPIFSPTSGAGATVDVSSILYSLNNGVDVTILTGFNGMSGDGNITVDSAIVASGSGNLILSAYKNITVNAAISLNHGNLTLRADNAGTGAGAVQVYAAIDTHGGNITIGGGSLAITPGVGFAKGDASSPQGVLIEASVDAGGGTIIMNGMGGSAAGNNIGVQISNGGIVRSTGGIIHINGKGGSVFASNHGVAIMGEGSAIIVDGGAQANITGVGGTDSGWNAGILVQGGADIMVDGAGTKLRMDGTGGDGHNGYNRGLFILGEGGDSNIRISGGAGATLIGKGGSGDGGHNLGISISGNGEVIAGTASVVVDGASSTLLIDAKGGTGIDGLNQGLHVVDNGKVQGTGGASLDIRADGGSGGYANQGFYSNAVNGLSTEGGGAIILKLSRSGNGYGFYANVAGVVSTTDAGDVTVYTDTILLDAAGFNVSGKLTIAPYSDMSLGVGAASGYDVNLDDTLLGYLNAGSYQFGTTHTFAGVLRTQDVSVLTGVDFGTKHVSYVSGRDLFVESALTRGVGSSGATTLSAARSIRVNAAITQRGGTLLIRSDSLGNGSGSVRLLGTITTYGGDITIGGGTGTITAGNGYATSTNSGVQVSAELNAGGGHIIINGRGTTNTSAASRGVHVLSSILTSGVGTITITGVGGSAGGTNVSGSQGVLVEGASTVISTVQGGLTITGTGGGSGTGNGNGGVAITTGATVSSDDGLILIHGRGGNGSGGSADGVGIIGAYVRTTGNGDIIIKARKGVLSGVGLSVTAANALQTTGNGDITAYIDGLYINTIANSINSANMLTIAAYDDVGMSVGGNIAGTLNMGAEHLPYLHAASYVFGAATTHDGVTANTKDLTVDTDHNFGDADVTFIAGQTILLKRTLEKTTGAGVANYLFRANNAITNTAGAGINATSGGINLVFDADYDNNLTGQIVLVGATAIHAGTGSISFEDAVSIGGDTSLSGNGITFKGAVSFDMGGTRTLSVDAGSGTFSAKQIGTLGVKVKDLSVIADDMVLDGDIFGSGTLTIQPSSITREVYLGYGTSTGGELHLDTTEIGHIKDGWQQILVGKPSAWANMHIGGTWSDPVTFRSLNRHFIYELTGTGNASFTFDAGWADLMGNVTTAGGKVDFSGLDTYLYSELGAKKTISTSGGHVLFNDLNVNESSSDLEVITSNGNISVMGRIYTGSANAPNKKTIFNAGTGTVTITGTVDGGSDLIVRAGDISFGSAIGTTLRMGNLDLASISSLTLPSIQASTVLARTTGAAADLILASGSTIDASGVGDAIVLAAARNFRNLSGSTDPLTFTGGGRWLVYTTSLANNVRGGMMPDGSNFNVTYDANPPSGIAAGNRFLYSAATAPVITYTLANGSVTYGDVFDISGLTPTYTSGLVGGDTLATIGLSGAPTVSTSYVQGTTNASATAYNGMISGSVSSMSSKLGYTFTLVSGALKVNKRDVTVTGLSGGTKTYDGTRTATIGGTGTLHNALIGAQLAINSATGQALFTSADVGNGKAITVSGYTLTGLDAVNYNLIQPIGLTGSITKKTLTVVAEAQTIHAGKPVPAAVIRYYGFAAGQDKGVIDVLATATSQHVGYMPVGSYVNNYMPQGASDTNYDFQYVAGNLTVIAAAIEPPPLPPPPAMDMSIPPIVDINRRIRDIEQVVTEAPAMTTRSVGPAADPMGTVVIEDSYAPVIELFNPNDCSDCRRI